MSASEIEEVSSGDEGHDQAKDFDGGDLQETGKKKKGYRYRDNDDIRILQEVLLERPVGKGACKKWKEIFSRLNLPVASYRSIQFRFEKLVDAHKKDMLKSLRGSGTEEDYDQKCQLLTDILEQWHDWTNDISKAQQSARKKDDESQKKAVEIRNASARGLVDTDLTQPESMEPYQRKRRRSEPNYIEILKSSEDAKNESEMRRLDIMDREFSLKKEESEHRREMEVRQLLMDERRLELEEKRMRIEEKKLEKEFEERALLLKMASSQNK